LILFFSLQEEMKCTKARGLHMKAWGS